MSDSTPPPLKSASLETIGLNFLVTLFEGEIAVSPDRPDLLANLGELYTRVGRFEDGLRIDHRLTELLPEDPVAHYNLACSLSLMGRLDPALASLRRAVELGYRDFAFLESDADLKNLRRDPGFRAWYRALRGGRHRS